MRPQTTKLQENYSTEIAHVGKVAMKFEGTKLTLFVPRLSVLAS